MVMPHLRVITIVVLTAGLMRADEGTDFFESKIRPVITEHCLACHSADAAKAGKLKGGLKLDSREGMRKGGDTGPAVVPGDTNKGTLLASLRHDGDLRMPPKGKLPDAIAADFAKWISMGAPDPRDGSTGAKSPLASGALPWSFMSPKATGPESPGEIDRLIASKRAEKVVKAAGPADRRALARRLYFDLVGLPPSPAEVEAFVADNRPGAYSDLVDRLLASPHYGERMARHWLDVARYAEDQAHTFAVKPKSNAFRYRDWVIAAMNGDMPYDQFIRFQLAGDLMPESSGDAFTRLAGLGLIGLGAEYYKNTAREQAIADELDDRVDTVTRGFLGITVSCARCHDHKFDPISQVDYYSLAGVFNGFSNVDAPLAPSDAVAAYDKAQKDIKDAEGRVNAILSKAGEQAARESLGKLAETLAAAQGLPAGKNGAKEVEAAAKAADVSAYFLGKWIKFLGSGPAGKVSELAPVRELKPGTGRDKVSAACQAAAKAVRAAAESAKPNDHPLMKALRADKNGPLSVPPEDAEKFFLMGEAKTSVARMREEVAVLKKNAPPMYPVAHAIRGGGQTMPLFIRGNPLKKGAPAPKGFPESLSRVSASKGESYGRLQLADAIASRDNPLTARVMVNRVWERHFGKGLVGTPSNFGQLGDKPTNPELLDTLAVRFMEHGWSLKWLHRAIVMSETYRLSSLGESGAAVDPANSLLWKANRRRLDVEVWRDALLAVSGNLDETMGGPTYDLRDAGANRRTVYAKVSRHNLDGLLRLFDFPDANVTSDKRSNTTVPQQQLFALNSDFMIRQAKAFAARLAKESKGDAEAVKRAYQLAFGRSPAAGEASRALAFLADPVGPDDKLSRREQFAQAILASNEFMFVD
ncbi:MAG: DUF1553 domain-containing protein [Planctomycetes bacterium]|nr:DUF1553 domain-containing protein [Planctomycetota bacterium]